MNRRLRLAVVRDFRAEGWPSMDLCADQLLAQLPSYATADDIAPQFHRLLSRLPIPRRVSFNADRLIHRHLVLPTVVRRAAHHAEFVHVVDHSYAHVVRAVPRGRAGVYCHDLDAFRSLLEPEKEPRPRWFRWLARRTLDGLKRAAVVFYNSVATGQQLLDAGLVSQHRLVHAPLGIADEFLDESTAVDLPVTFQTPFLLHVGNNIPRKRLDVLLEVFAAARKGVPELRLVQVGGPWLRAQANQIERLGIGSFVTQVRGLSRAQLAGLYRRAAAVVVTSEAEGFGLPVIEALACGALVLASDIPTLREAGGGAVIYCPVGNVQTWTAAVVRALLDPASSPARDVRLAHAARFSWREHACTILEAYRSLRERHTAELDKRSCVSCT